MKPRLLSRSTVWALLALLSSGCLDSQRPGTAATATAFVHVNVVSMEQEGILRDHTVVVVGDRIESLGPSDSFNPPRGSRVIDGSGKYLMPGLADMHVHVHLSNYGVTDPDVLTLFLANGVTTVRNMQGSPEILDWRGRIEAGDLVGPRIYTTGPVLDGEPPFWPGSISIETPEEAEQEVAAQKKAGYDGIKVLANISPEAYEAVLAAAARHEIPVYGHAPTRLGLGNALNSGQRSFEHMSDFIFALLPDDSPIRAHLVDMWDDRTKMNWRGMFLDPYEQADRAKIPDIAAKAAEGGAWFCPTLAAYRNFATTVAEFEQLRSDPTMRYVPPQIQSVWDGTAKYLSTDENNDPAIMKRGFETMVLAAKALNNAGVRLIIGTDSPSAFGVPGFSIHEELEIFVEAGLTPYEAIKAATHDAAEFVDSLDEWGTVGVGRRADLILVEANPLEDVANASRQVGVMLRGHWYPKAELQAKLDALAEKYAKMKAEGEATVAIENVNVVPMDREAVLPDRTVMVRDGKIVSIAPASEADVPAFATRIDGTGKYLMPGLADMHVHLPHDADGNPGMLGLFVANGVTTVRNMWGIPVHLQWRSQIAAGELHGPTIYTTGPITDGDPPLWPGSALVTEPEQAEPELLAQKAAGYDAMKVMTNLRPEVYDAILAASAKQDFPVYGHAQSRVGLLAALGQGQRSFEHLLDTVYALLPDDSPVRSNIVEAYEQRDLRAIFDAPFRTASSAGIPALAAEFAGSGVWICPTLVVHQRFLAGPEEIESLRHSPVLSFVAPDRREGWEALMTRRPSYLSEDGMRRGLSLETTLLKALHDADARLLLGTDTGNPYVVAGFAVHDELRNFVAAGMTPYEALSAATSNAAEFLGALDEFGTVAIGQRADLILVEANPLEDVTNVAKRVGVMLRGQWLDEAELQSRLEAFAESLRDADGTPETTGSKGQGSQ
jgi:imidazolonepropionase-like amidohydrolase